MTFPLKAGLVAVLAAMALTASASGSSVEPSEVRSAAGGDSRQAASPRPWQPHVWEATAYAKRRLGRVSFAVRTEKRLVGYRMERTVPSASVVKAMLMVAYLNHPAVRHRRLRWGDRRLLSPMVRRSDNVTATRIRDYVGNWRLKLLAHRVGMRHFRTARIWGQSRICAADQTKLFLRLGSYVVRRHRDAARTLLGSIVPSQRWGIARVKPRGWRLYFKGGWGSGTGAVDHQAALLTRGRERVAVTILTSGNPSHAYAKQTLRGVAWRLLRGLARAPQGSVPAVSLP